MLNKKILLIIFFLASHICHSQNSIQHFAIISDSLKKIQATTPVLKQFAATCDFLDAAINSLNSFSGLIRNENYPIKIT